MLAASFILSRRFSPSIASISKLPQHNTCPLVEVDNFILRPPAPTRRRLKYNQNPNQNLWAASCNDLAAEAPRRL